MIIQMCVGFFDLLLLLHRKKYKVPGKDLFLILAVKDDSHQDIIKAEVGARDRP